MKMFVLAVAMCAAAFAQKTTTMNGGGGGVAGNTNTSVDLIVSAPRYVCPTGYTKIPGGNCGKEVNGEIRYLDNVGGDCAVGIYNGHMAGECVTGTVVGATNNLSGSGQPLQPIQLPQLVSIGIGISQSSKTYKVRTDMSQLLRTLDDELNAARAKQDAALSRLNNAKRSVEEQIANGHILIFTKDYAQATEDLDHCSINQFGECK